METGKEESKSAGKSVPFTPEEFTIICIETKTGHDVFSFDKKNKYATPEQIDAVFKLNFTRSRELTVLHNLNFTPQQASEIAKQKMLEGIPTFEPKEKGNKNVAQNAKNLAQNIEKGTRGLHID